eukprot:1875272-Amphidinium_carterae.1
MSHSCVQHYKSPSPCHDQFVLSVLSHLSLAHSSVHSFRFGPNNAKRSLNPSNVIQLSLEPSLNPRVHSVSQGTTSQRGGLRGSCPRDLKTLKKARR